MDDAGHQAQRRQPDRGRTMTSRSLSKRLAAIEAEARLMLPAAPDGEFDTLCWLTVAELTRLERLFEGLDDPDAVVELPDEFWHRASDRAVRKLDMAEIDRQERASTQLLRIDHPEHARGAQVAGPPIEVHHPSPRSLRTLRGVRIETGRREHTPHGFHGGAGLRPTAARGGARGWAGMAEEACSAWKRRERSAAGD